MAWLLNALWGVIGIIQKAVHVTPMASFGFSRVEMRVVSVVMFGQLSPRAYAFLCVEITHIHPCDSTCEDTSRESEAGDKGRYLISPRRAVDHAVGEMLSAPR